MDAATAAEEEAKAAKGMKAGRHPRLSKMERILNLFPCVLEDADRKPALLAAVRPGAAAMANIYWRRAKCKYQKGWSINSSIS